MRPAHGRFLAATAAGMLLITGFTGTAYAAPSTADAPSTDVARNSAAVTESAQDRATDYWTPARMRAATMLTPEVNHGRAEGTAAPGPRHGEPRSIAPTAPERKGSATNEPTAIPEGGAPWDGEGEVRRSVGRVFFTMGGRDSACSGTAVTSANKSVVITAGHCVKYQNSWHENWVFVPGYDKGEAPYGEFAATETLTTPQWEDSEQAMDYDIGAAVVAPGDDGALTDVVGAQGIAFNGERGLDMYSFGYPAQDPYDGETLIYCSGTAFEDPFVTNDYGLSCDMTGGSSGGPWFVGFDEEAGTGQVSSVNSFGYTFLPDTMFGPYFGEEAETLYDTAQGR